MAVARSFLTPTRLNAVEHDGTVFVFNSDDCSNELQLLSEAFKEWLQVDVVSEAGYVVEEGNHL